MKTTEALRIAADRVSISPQGRQYMLHTWSPRHDATYVSHPMDRSGVQSAAWETKAQIALELLGVEDAAALVHGEVERGTPREDWRACVRRLARNEVE